MLHHRIVQSCSFFISKYINVYASLLYRRASSTVPLEMHGMINLVRTLSLNFARKCTGATFCYESENMVQLGVEEVNEVHAQCSVKNITPLYASQYVA